MGSIDNNGTAIYPSLNNRVVLVTGGGSGIGAAIVERFCEQGSRVSFIDLDDEASRQLTDRIRRKGGNVPRYLRCDLRDIDALRHAVESVIEADGPVRALVNNAARDDRHAIDEVTPDYFDDRIAVNLRHHFFTTQAVYPGMAAAGGGSIVNMGSVTWMIGQGGMPIYSAAKSAIVGLTRSLARDLGPKNIRVNSVLPGWIMTERQVENWLTPEGEAELMERQCLKRKLGPDEIAKVVLFFAADDSGICTNQNYVADGGWV
ncbi:MAG: SDR family oxidoreductase [Alphaproteobacteria bacterium]|nr:SDR family oxidoreductase [Alphaproteobacteria bacterium]